MSDLALEPQAPVEATPEPVEPSWEGPTQEAWEQTQAELNWFREQAARAQEPEPDYSQFDPFNDNFAQNYAQLAQRVEEIASYVQQAQGREGQELLIDVIHDDISRNGELLMGEDAFPQVIAAARQLMPDMQRRYGNGDRAAEEAIYKAMSAHREQEQALRQRIIDQHTNQLSTLANAPREPGAGGASPAGQLSVAPRTTQELLQKYLGN